MAVQAGKMGQNAAPQGVSFASELTAALGKISETQQTARKQAQDFELGVPGISLNDVMVDLQKSSVFAAGRAGAQQAGGGLPRYYYEYAGVMKTLCIR